MSVRAPYTATAWYWLGDFMPAGTAWSSASLSYVPTETDPGYLAFVGAGTRPTTIGSADDLIEVMLNQVVPALSANGITITSTGTPALNGVYDMDEKSQRQISGIVTGINAGVMMPPGGVPWSNAAGPVLLSGAQMTALGTVILLWEMAIATFITLAVSGQPATQPGQSGTIP